MSEIHLETSETNLENSEKNENQVSATPYSFLESLPERVVFLILLTVVSFGPLLLREGFPAHADWHSHAANAYHFKKAFLQGQFLPRWLDTGMFGYGLPKFNYYAPLLYYIYTFLDIVFRNPIISMKYTLILTMALCTVSGYIYLRRHGSPVAAALASAFIIFSPAIHIYTYNNNFPTNTLAIPFLFVVLYGIDTFDKNKDFDIKSFLLISFGYAMIVLSHLATAFMFTLLLVPYFALNLFLYKTRKFIKHFILSFALGGALSAFYLLPASKETNFVHTEVLSIGAGWDYTKNFLFTYLDRLPQEGYYWGIFDHRYYEVTNALFGLVALISIVVLFSNLDNLKNFFKEPFRIYIAVLMFIIAFLMMTPVSLFVWVLIKQMKTLQFPWRFTSLIVPFGALTMVYAFDFINKSLKQNINIQGYKFLIYTIAGLLGLLLYVNYINIFRWYWTNNENFLRHSTNVVWQNREYLPNLSGDPNWEQIDYGRDFSPTVQSSDPNCDVKLIKWLSHHRTFQVFSPYQHQVRLRIFNFPGWNVYIDGQKTNIVMEQRTGVITFTVLPGQHEINVQFENTQIRKTGKYISLIALVIFLFLFFRFFEEWKLRRQQIKEVSDSLESLNNKSLEVEGVIPE